MKRDSFLLIQVSTATRLLTESLVNSWGNIGPYLILSSSNMAFTLNALLLIALGELVKSNDEFDTFRYQFSFNFTYM